MAKLKIRYPLGEAICPVCSNVFNRLRWWAIYCSPNCRRLDHAARALHRPVNASDASCAGCVKLEERIRDLERENAALRSRLTGQASARLTGQAHGPGSRARLVPG